MTDTEKVKSHLTMPESIFADLALAPADAIFALTAAYKTDDFTDKVNLGVGAYRDDNGKPYVLPVVHKVSNQLLLSCEHQSDWCRLIRYLRLMILLITNIFPLLDYLSSCPRLQN